MHPSARILLYLISALALPGLNFYGLALLAVIGLVLSRQRCRHNLGLLWRARWLFLLLGVGYAYSLPGPAVLPLPWDLSPAWPGVMAGAGQMARLALLLLLLDALLVSQGSEAMMSGLYGLFRALRRFGFPAELAAVRIGLTLRAMEEKVDRRIGLADLLGNGQGSVAEEEGSLVLPMKPWRTRDAFLVIAATLGLATAWLV